MPIAILLNPQMTTYNSQPTLSALTLLEFKLIE
jgi:hypothetical protein